jgi:Endoplasmic reticulum-based factor for assembly of V-ATPase
MQLPWNLPGQKRSIPGKFLCGIGSTPELRAVLKNSLNGELCDVSDSSQFFHMPSHVAISLVQEYLDQEEETPIPLDVIRAATILLKKEHLLVFNTKLSSTKLIFKETPPPTMKTEDEARKFEKRMDRLRLREEESRYKYLTGNIDHYVADDVTVKSMTYAASIGLNMIVAPISFGVFMYFFAGQIFSWISATPTVELKPHEVDIRRVIAGVVSGVGMLFIEMILFVIRTHTMDKSVRKKERQKKTISPFGFAKPNAPTVLTQDRKKQQ